MELANSIVLALGLSADACAVSLSSGLTIKHIKVNKAIKIALFFGIFQGIMPLIGWLGGLAFRGSLARFDHWIIFLILSCLGVKMIYEAFEDGESESKSKFNCLDTYTLIALSIATSIDALAAGLGLSILKTPIFSTVAIIGLVTFVSSLIAVYLGHFFGEIFKQKIEILGGTVLIFLGSKILLEALI